MYDDKELQQRRLGDLYDALAEMVKHTDRVHAGTQLANLCKLYGTENVRRMLLVLAEDLLHE